MPVNYSRNGSAASLRAVPNGLGDLHHSKPRLPAICRSESPAAVAPVKLQSRHLDVSRPNRGSGAKGTRSPVRSADARRGRLLGRITPQPAETNLSTPPENPLLGDKSFNKPPP